jgi:uncharacterized protein (DUF4415 family)
MSDSDIDYSDIPPLGDEFFQKATVAWPPVKRQLTIRLDGDVLNWLKSSGRGYQTRINHILRVAMQSTMDSSQARKASRTPSAVSVSKKNTRARRELRSA